MTVVLVLLTIWLASAQNGTVCLRIKSPFLLLLTRGSESINEACIRADMWRCHTPTSISAWNIQVYKKKIIKKNTSYVRFSSEFLLQLFLLRSVMRLIEINVWSNGDDTMRVDLAVTSLGWYEPTQQPPIISDI